MDRVRWGPRGWAVLALALFLPEGTPESWRLEPEQAWGSPAPSSAHTGLTHPLGDARGPGARGSAEGCRALKLCASTWQRVLVPRQNAAYDRMSASRTDALVLRLRVLLAIRKAQFTEHNATPFCLPKRALFPLTGILFLHIEPQIMT